MYGNHSLVTRLPGLHHTATHVSAADQIFVKYVNRIILKTTYILPWSSIIGILSAEKSFSEKRLVV